MTKTFTELLDKRAEFSARRDGLKAEIAKIDGDIAALDRVLAMLDPGYRPPTLPSHASERVRSASAAASCPSACWKACVPQTTR